MVWFASDFYSIILNSNYHSAETLRAKARAVDRETSFEIVHGVMDWIGGVVST